MELVKCPSCGRTIAHYLEGEDAKYRVICPKCKKPIIIYSAGKTAVVKPIMQIELNIKF